jgi:hypothetical protein
VRRSAIISVFIALLLLLAAVQVVAAGDQVKPPSPDASIPAPDALPSGGSGEISIDPVFLTPTPDATTATIPRSSTRRPDPTPPATDAVMPASAEAGPGSPALIPLVAAAFLILLIAARLPAARHR